MKSLFLLFFISFNLYALSPGTKAPDFKLTNQEGREVKLSDFKGQYIVIEWYNGGCPYVRKHYDSKNIQTLQNLYKHNKLVTWLTISSSAKGKQGFVLNSKKAKGILESEKSGADHFLLDAKGVVGHLYDAASTPYFVIVNHDGIIAYTGAIDSIASAKISDIKKAKNYISSGMNKLLLGEKLNPQKTKAYGCSVKY